MNNKDYKPDWDNIPKEFKYCYYSVNGHSGKVEKKLFSNCKMLPSVIGKMQLKRIDRPPELVDGAWYACSESRGKFIGWYGAKDNLIASGMEYYKPENITIHQRIPDSMWDIEDEQ